MHLNPILQININEIIHFRQVVLSLFTKMTSGLEESFSKKTKIIKFLKKSLKTEFKNFI